MSDQVSPQRVDASGEGVPVDEDVSTGRPLEELLAELVRQQGYVAVYASRSESLVSVWNSCEPIGSGSSLREALENALETPPGGTVQHVDGACRRSPDGTGVCNCFPGTCDRQKAEATP